MTKDELVDWLQKLRSGEYKQTRSAWGNVGGYCCLGLLAVHVTKDCVDDDLLKREDEEIFKRIRNQVDDTFSTIKSTLLIDLNDDDGASFAQIADYIEERARKEGFL